MYYFQKINLHNKNTKVIRNINNENMIRNIQNIIPCLDSNSRDILDKVLIAPQWIAFYLQTYSLRCVRKYNWCRNFGNFLSKVLWQVSKLSWKNFNWLKDSPSLGYPEHFLKFLSKLLVSPIYERFYVTPATCKVENLYQQLYLWSTSPLVFYWDLCKTKSTTSS